MQDESNEPTQEVEAPVEEQVEAPAEDQPAEAAAPAPATEEPAEDIDLNQYWHERYQAPAEQTANPLVDEVRNELSRLPTDEAGTVEADAAAQWFADKLNQVRTDASRDAARSAERAAMSVVSEAAQQQELLKKFPEIVKDRETLDTIFDLRDAAALRGQTLTLEAAAAKLNKLRQQGKQEGAATATRTTTIQAAAHLESSSVKGDSSASEEQELANRAFGQADAQARRELLKRFVTKELKDGRIQHP